MSLWLAADPLVLASRSAVRRALLEAAGIPIEAASGRSRRAAVWKPASPRRSRRRSRRLLAREKASVGRASASGPAGARRRSDAWRSAASALPSRPIAQRRARAACARFAGAPTSFIRRLRSCRTATLLFEHVGTARLTMRAFSDRFLDRYLDAVGDAATASVGAYQIEGLGIQLFERIDGDYFTILGLAAACRRSISLRRQGCPGAMSGERPFRPVPDRLARHGQIDGRRSSLPKRACRCTIPTPPCMRFMRAKPRR